MRSSVLGARERMCLTDNAGEISHACHFEAAGHQCASRFSGVRDVREPAGGEPDDSALKRLHGCAAMPSLTCYLLAPLCVTSTTLLWRDGNGQSVCFSARWWV